LNDVINLDIKRMGINGEGIGYYQQLAVFVDNALPGENVDVEITEVFENRAVGILKNIIKKSKNRIDPFCAIYDQCGGCQTQHFNYNAMLAQKKDILAKALDRYVKNYPQNVIKPTIGMEDPMHYRNKATLPLRKVDGKNRFGMYQRNSNIFVPIEDCGVQHQRINDVFHTLVELMDKYQIDAYNKQTKEGFISHAVVRITQNLNEIQVSFIVPKRVESIYPLVHELVEKHPEILSIYEVVNNQEEVMSFFTEESYLLFGKQKINEMLHENQFTLKPEAFFQLNTYQADKFYQKMKEVSNLTGNEVVIDAYAGIAPISHYIYQDAKKVYAIEINKDAVESAKES